MRELSLRYEGLLNQMWVVGRGRGPGSAAERALLETRIWQRLLDGARAPIDPRGLPALFWAAAEAELGPALRPLRRRFMLRPFIDAMSEGGDLFRLLAYGSRAAEHRDDREARRALELACPALHRALLGELESVEAWTGGEISSAEVLDQKPPYTGLLRWLFALPSP